MWKRSHNISQNYRYLCYFYCNMMYQTKKGKARCMRALRRRYEIATMRRLHILMSEDEVATSGRSLLHPATPPPHTLSPSATAHLAPATPDLAPVIPDLAPATPDLAPATPDHAPATPDHAPATPVPPSGPIFLTNYIRRSSWNLHTILNPCLSTRVQILNDISQHQPHPKVAEL
nr:uncharacterized protein LOC123753345 [Procambarus clarkii]